MTEYQSKKIGQERITEKIREVVVRIQEIVGANPIPLVLRGRSSHESNRSRR